MKYSLESLEMTIFFSLSVSLLGNVQFCLAIDWSQSPIFLRDRGCRSVSLIGRHLGLLILAKLGRVPNGVGTGSGINIA